MLDFLADHREGRLAPAEQERFAAHLDRCPDCVAYLASYERVVALARLAVAAPDGPPPGEAPAELVAAILAARRSGDEAP